MTKRILNITKVIRYISKPSRKVIFSESKKQHYDVAEAGGGWGGAGVDTGWVLVSQGARRLGAPRIQSFSASPSPNWLWVALSRHVAPLRS